MHLRTSRFRSSLIYKEKKSSLPRERLAVRKGLSHFRTGRRRPEVHVVSQLLPISTHKRPWAALPKLGYDVSVWRCSKRGTWTGAVDREQARVVQTNELEKCDFILSETIATHPPTHHLERMHGCTGWCGGVSGQRVWLSSRSTSARWLFFWYFFGTAWFKSDKILNKCIPPKKRKKKKTANLWDDPLMNADAREQNATSWLCIPRDGHYHDYGCGFSLHQHFTGMHACALP